MMESGVANEWNELRREGRRVESTLESAMQALCRLEQLPPSSNVNDYDIEQRTHMSNEDRLMESIEDALNELSNITDRMRELRSYSASTTNNALLQRYREVHRDYRTELRKLQTSVTRKRERASLFRDFRASGDKDSSRHGTDRDHLLRERTAVQNSSRAADDVLGQASAVRSTLKNQRGRLLNTNTSMSTLANRFPAIGGVITAIGRKRNRDNVILSIVIAICIIITFYLWKK